MTYFQSHTRELWQNRTVGLLGGSFNPAHGGHRHISLYALKMLRLDAVWWMVSPQNPLKSEKGMAPLAERMESAREASRHPKIHVTDIEQRLGTRYTADTLAALQTRFPNTHFIWLMGADNLRQVHKWQEWEKIFESVPVCVLDRPPRHSSIKNSKASIRFRPFLLTQDEATQLKSTPAPAWTILHIPLDATSATEIRARKKRK